MHPYVHSNTIHNSQDIEATGQGQFKCPWTDVDREDVVCILCMSVRMCVCTQ